MNMQSHNLKKIPGATGYGSAPNS